MMIEEGELEENSTCRKFRQVREEGNRTVSRMMPYYNLDMIISLGYRIRSLVATQLRRWATTILKEYMVKGFALDDEKLKGVGGGAYWKELIYERADADKPFMGLKSFKGDFPVKSDIGIAKNYLDEDELKILNNLVSGYFDFAEIQAMRHNPMHMSDYVQQFEEAYLTR